MEIKQDVSLQLKLINRIQEVIPVNYSLVDELGDLLEMSSDSAYRRLRGETVFTIDEIATICNHFKISFDSLINSDIGSVAFKYRL